ncbi:Cell division cycle protein cdt2 [Colletotrichum siamense]|uniref:Cell division cycle protein cdt2 n=1 Tax=Colletotrichum siamense TaxID=690259 RepID=A0A9P5EXU9_COLSI|nr:Cell division cycle protein cdt2 [Colletotrichum siamense]KAF4861614.1 Cell division cycle protein cdt2 [Colletotrichum siamense]
MVYHGGMASPPPSDGLVPASSPTLPSSPPPRNIRKEKRKAILTPRKFTRFFTPRGTSSQSSRPVLAEMGGPAINAQQTPPRSSLGAPEPISPTSTSSLLSPFGSDDGPKKRKRGVVHAIPMKLPLPARGSSTKLSRTQLEDLEDDEAPLGRSPLARSLLENVENVDDQAIGSPDVHSPTGPELPPLGRKYPTGPQTSPDEFARKLSSLTASNFATAAYEGLRPRSTLIDYFKCNRAGVQASGKGKPLSSLTKPLQPSKEKSPEPPYHPQPVIKLRNRGFEAQLLLREQGSTPRPGRQHLEYPAFDSRATTASFWSKGTDTQMINAHLTQSNTIPFSLASCHNAPLTAIGDEEGFIRFFDTTTTQAGETPKAKVDIIMQGHENAIMDLAFSDDDLRLVSACGDRSGKIFDVMTQSVAAELNGGHFQSMRRVEFQPGRANGSVIATSDRDGKIQIWDLRCCAAPAAAFSTRGPEGVFHRNRSLSPLWARTTNTIDGAHARTVEGITSPASVTALQYMPPGREHLLLSASEANACIKLWDTRYITPRNRPDATPLAVTAEPATHRWRPYGLTSLALSSDAARLYAVCKDNTVYAYSTSHLMLGHAPELSDRPPRQKAGTAAQGLGPLYGFKHDMFHVKSFYVRCAVRPVSITGTELLAVGSDKCALLFPTDERAMREHWDTQSHLSTAAEPTTAAAGGNSKATTGQVPIVRNGTPLIRGHRREVTGLSWTNEGKLVTISDDYMARHWQEGDDNSVDAANGCGPAWDLRTGGEFGGRRHMSGYADVSEDWDMDDDMHSEC